MKKRICSLLMAMALLIGMFSALQASAAATPITEGWFIQEYKNVTGNATCTVEVANVGYQSGHSLYINMTSDDTGKNWLNIENTGINSYEASDRYTVSFRIKKVDNTGSYPDILFGWTSGGNRLESKNEGYIISDADADGWQLVTASTTADAKRYFQLNIQKDEFEAYIDDFVVTKNGDTTNLLVNGSFEEGIAWEPAYPTVSAPTTTKALEEWTTIKDGTGTATTNTVVTAVGTENAYSGNNSMYVEFAADSYGQNWLAIKNTGTPKASLNAAAYTVSMYVKGNKLGNASILMGWKYDDRYDENTRNYQMLSRMSATEPEDAAKAADGWRKYTVVLNAPETDFTINIQCAAKVYIDDVSVVAVGDATGTNLLNNPGFEGITWEPAYPTVSAPTTTKALEEWTTKKDGTGTATTNTVVTAVGAENAYSGNNSMYVEFAADSYGQNWLGIKNTGTPKASLNAAAYTVSMYVKGNKLSNASILMGWKYDDKYDENTRNYQMLSRMSATEPEDAAKAADGWRKYTVVLNAPETDFTINIQCAAKVYIDDVSVVAVGDATGTNLLNNPGFEESSVVLPDITEEALDTTKWNLSTGNIGTGAYTAGVTAMEAQHGKKSLHVTWSASGTGYIQLQAKMNKLTDNESYTLKAHIKRISGNSAKIGSWKDWGGTGVGNTSEGEWEEMTIAEQCVGGPKIVQIILEGTTGVDMYIDNMVLTDSNGNEVWSEDFETATTGYETSAIKLFDENLNEITALSSDLDGKTITGAVAVTNYDKANLTGQLIIALYDGYELKELIMSDKVDILTTGTGTTLITKEFTMPEYKSTYKIKAFIWDSIESMKPLSRTMTEL